MEIWKGEKLLELIKLGTILKMTKGKKPIVQSKGYQDGYMPYVNIQAFETKNIENYTDGDNCLLCDDGDILIVCDGSRSGMVGRAIKGAVGSTLAKVSAEGLTNDYLFHFLQGKFLYLNTKTKGTGTPHVNKKHIENFELIVPSVKEQKRIVAKIEELFSNLDASVAELQLAKEKLELYRQAVLKESFKNFTEKKPIRLLSALVTSGSRGWAQYYSDCGSKFIRIGNLTHDSIDICLNDIQYVSLPESIEGTRTHLESQDVLVSITANLGSVGYVSDNIGGDTYINQHIALIRWKKPVQGKFMAWYLRSDFGQKELLKNKRGAGKLGLGLEDIRNTCVPCVDDNISTLTVKNLESKISVCNSIEKIIDKMLLDTNALRQSILKQAFEGRLL